MTSKFHVKDGQKGAVDTSTPTHGDIGLGQVVEKPQLNVWEALDVESKDLYEEAGFVETEVNQARALADSLTLDETKQILQDFVNTYQHDMLISRVTIERARTLLADLSAINEPGSNVEYNARIWAAILQSNSVYREVRAVTDPVDDTSIPCGTIRAWVIGLFCACGLAAINQFFAPRQPAITVTAYLAQLIGFGLGRISASILPSTVFLRGSQFEFSLNPGPFNLKEQTLITIMANVSYATPQISTLFFMQRLPMYLDSPWAASFGYGMCMMLSTQLLGYGLAGMCRRFLVYEPSMVWFYVLSQLSMNRAFFTHNEATSHGWKISRFRFFFCVFGIAFIYYWIPGTMFPTLTFFNWMTWIKPTSATLAIVTGTYYFNMGFNPLATFDYQWLATLDPFVTPFFVIFQIIMTLAFWGICVIMPVFFTNTWYTGYLPINSWFSYDNNGQVYDTSKILGTNHRLNQTAYESYSQVFLPAAVGLRYAGMMCIIPAMLVFTALYHGSAVLVLMKKIFKGASQFSGHRDVHTRLMSKYTEVGEWVYLLVAAGAAGLGFAAFYVWPTNVPGWVIPIAFVCSAIFIIPIGIVCSITGYLTDLEIIFNIIGGCVCDGDPIGTFIFKVMGKGIVSQGVYFISDMKLGHYAKVPPIQMMLAQLVATIFASIVSLGIIEFQITGIEGICDPTKQSRFICSNVSLQWTSAIVWGVIGPKRLFSPGSLYRFLPIGFLVGALWPLGWWALQRKWPQSFLRYAHPIVMMVAPILWAPLNFSNFFQSLPISWFFGYYVKTRFPTWWGKYNYLISTGLITGIAFSVFIQFFSLSYNDISFPDWWGTTKFTTTCDLQDCRYLTLAPGETFGPSEWH
ncbi:hypothetical protein ABOM_003346 [Aspergillus bombycis]|uniref:Oligopeptide transporter n=1 Tax=Aspergillus bombycis TaxID=109264 RepID=A0A1F8A7Z1_9EURO|nr:hypothetical protein ABOM_003346 [Aspergillus bombycis]OGM47811.1 hypothetical protein ABOM_003346 [Aspergillus bombycis]